MTAAPAVSAEQSATVSALRRRLAQRFGTAGLDTPELDARLLMQHALDCDHIELFRSDRRELSLHEINRVDLLADRRMAGEPVARIVGRKEFWGLDFEIGPATLVPRPETETMVQVALQAFGSSKTTLRVADFGTGSGAILLSLLHEMPQAYGVGIDISEQACAVAARNAARLGLHGRSAFAVSNFGAALGDNSVDLIVSNPPYIASGEISALSREVRDHDPRLALDGGPDGLEAYRAIAVDAARLLQTDGRIFVELGAGQAGAVTDIFQAAGLSTPLPPIPDLAGIPRVLEGRRP
jgi:release factor glutamine methyltransferase